MGLVIFGMYYGLDVLAHPLVFGPGLLLAFLGGVVLRRRRRRLHRHAFNDELANQDSSPPA